MRRNGQSSLELLIALTIFSLVMGAVITLVFGAQASSIFGGESSRALGLAREGLDRSGAVARNDFSSLVNSSSSEDIFTKSIIVEELDPYTKRVTSRVQWSIDPLKQDEIDLTGIYTDWRRVRSSSGDTGGGGTTGDWKNPQTLGSVDLGPGASATGLDVFQKYIYLSADASDSKKEDFFVVDATNGRAPSIVSKIDTGPGLSAVDVAGSYAFAAAESASGQLQVIDVSNRSSSSLATTFSLPGSSGQGKSIFYADGKIFMGTLAGSGPEFHIIDISSPTSPVELGNLEIGADVNAIQVNGKYAYLATSDNSRELRILDISDPASIKDAGAYDAAGTEDAKSLYLLGSSLYLGRSSSGDPDFYILDISSPSSISSLGSKILGSSVNGIRVRDSLAFIGTSDANKEFQVWNVSDPANISMWSSFNFPQVASGVDYEDNLVYVSVRSNDAVRVITSGP